MRVVAAVGLVWLGMLAFPVTYSFSGVAGRGELGVGVAGLVVLAGVYVRAVIRIARDGAPRAAPVSLAVVAALSVALPWVAGSAWFGGTVLLAALLGLCLPAWAALVAVAAATGVASAQALLIDVSPAQVISIPLVTAVAGVIAVAVVRQSTLTRELAASRRTAERLAAEAERLRLARELHDSVKQHAFLAALELASARSRLGPDEHLDAAADAVAGVQRQLGEVIEHIRPPQQPLVPALREHVADWSRRTGVQVDLNLDADQSPPELPAEPLLPVAIEALTNVARHAGAHHVRVRLSATADQAELTIADDGRGFDVTRTPSGQGMRGMRERLAERAGTLEVRSGAGGTTVTAGYPVTLR